MATPGSDLCVQLRESFATNQGCWVTDVISEAGKGLTKLFNHMEAYQPFDPVNKTVALPGQYVAATNFAGNGHVPRVMIKSAVIMGRKKSEQSSLFLKLDK
jgi:hypothetical protein